MRLNAAGSAAMGTSVISIDGATPAALVGKVAGGYLGPSWLTASTILYQSGGTGAGPWILQSYNTGTLATATVDAAGQNTMGAGQGVWAAYLAGSGVRTSIGGLGPFPTGALGEVSTDFGEVCLLTSQATATGLTVYSSAGATLLSLPAVTLTIPLVRLRGHLLVYCDATGWKMAQTLGGAFAFAPRINEPVNWVTPVLTASGKRYVMERSERVTLRLADQAKGWELVAPGGLAFNPDAVEPSGSPGVIRVGYSLNQGESPAALMLIDITLATGATRVGTVSGSAIVWATGPTVPLTTFEVGPLQGTDTTSAAPLPRQDQPVVNRDGTTTVAWRHYFAGTNRQVSANTVAIAAMPPVSGSPSFGSLAGGAVPIAATRPDDLLTVASGDSSIGLTSDPAQKILDLRENLAPICWAASLRF